MQQVAHIVDWAYNNWLASETIEQALEWEIVLDDYNYMLPAVSANEVN
jgi:hypothetical protein